MPPHPLAALSTHETHVARDVILASYPGKAIFFRQIYLEEPAKQDLLPYLELEHSGNLSPTSPRPKRLAKCQYDVIGSEADPEFHEAVVDVEEKTRVDYTVVGEPHHAALDLYVVQLEFSFSFPLQLIFLVQRRI